MKNNSLVKTINHILNFRESIDITIHGNSMAPTLLDGDIVTIVKKNNYCVGDILIFKYRNEGLIAHRLLYINNAYFCKGDNSFRFEKIENDDILGKITTRNGDLLEKWPSWKNEFSKKIGNIFIENKDVTTTKRSYEYILYSLTVLKSNEYRIVRLINSDYSCRYTNKEMNVKKYCEFTLDELKLILKKLNSTFGFGDLFNVISQILEDDVIDAEELCLYVIIDFMNMGLIKFV